MPRILYFPYFGPNRRSDLRVVEARLEFSAAEARETGFDDLVRHVKGLLINAGILEDQDDFPLEPFRGPYVGGFTSLLAQTALLFQQKAGHRVGFHQARRRRYGDGWLALVEHEHCDVGMTAVKLAVELLTGRRAQLAGPFHRFAEFARERLLPLETEAIIAAARSRSIPYLQLDRQPLGHTVRNRARIRRNGLLQLGHGAGAHVLDGSYCSTLTARSDLPLTDDTQRRRQWLAGTGLPLADSGKHSADAARIHLFVVGDGHFPFYTGPDGQMGVLPGVPPSVRALAGQVQQETDHQPVEIVLAAQDDRAKAGADPLSVLDLHLAPDLGRLAGQPPDDSGRERLAAAAGNLVDWIFPDPRRSRIPTVAVTGTNGKTTTSRMVAHIFRRSGFRTGLVCTDGVFLDDRLLSEGDRSTMTGHAALLARRDVEAAVLETHHRGIAVRGFAFHRCDVAMVLNVTADHIKAGEIESVEEMAEIKRALLERAGGTAVVFADDPHCRAMLAHVPRGATPWLVSLESDAAKLRLLTGQRPAGFCVLEASSQGESIVLCSGERRLPVMRVDEIPATHDGTARFNVSNAMHATVAAYAAGVNPETIRAALADFGARDREIPGRLNINDRLPFRIVMDFAHNPDGVAKIADYCDRQSPDGRKILAFSIAPGRDPEFCRAMARAAAGHFDRYICKDYTKRPGFGSEALAPALRKALLECGVPAERISVAATGKKAAFEIFAACRPGDLLVYLVGHVEMHQLEAFVEEFAETTPGMPEPGEPGTHAS